MQEETIRKTKLASIGLSMLLFYQNVLGQVDWGVQLISQGKYEVDITPTKKKMKDVKVNIALYNSQNVVTCQDNLEFTTPGMELEVGQTYARKYDCDKSITKAIGTNCTSNIKVTYDILGGNADRAHAATPRAKEKLKAGNKTFINENNSELKSGSIYTLQNMDSRNILHGDNIESGGNVRQYQNAGIPCQQWVLTLNGDGTYSLQNMDTKYMLHGDNMESGGNVRQYQKLGIPCQSWWINRNADGTYSLKNVDTKNMLHGNNMESGGNVRQYPPSGILCQEWQFTEVVHNYSPNH